MSLNSKLKRIIIDLEIDCPDTRDCDDLENIIDKLKDMCLTEPLI